MAIDHAKDRIRVNSLSPGPIATERTLGRIGGEEQALAFYGPLTLTGRQGTVEEIADAALFLASEESRYMTGTDLLVDGGYNAR
ncbi:MAG: SDR family oxidoreductase [Rhodospirillales bacterium]|nr:SDR family oxidoreductase [Rhodospirillales bacterium]